MGVHDLGRGRGDSGQAEVGRPPDVVEEEVERHMDPVQADLDLEGCMGAGSAVEGGKDPWLEQGMLLEVVTDHERTDHWHQMMQ
jgi:hypothetical protein